MLAHNFRIKDKSFFSAETSSFTFRVPNSYLEFKLLSELLTNLVRCVSDQFPDLQQLRNQDARMIDKINLPAQEVNIDEEITQLMIELEPYLLKNQSS